MIVFNVDFDYYGSDPQAGYAIIRTGGWLSGVRFARRSGRVALNRYGQPAKAQRHSLRFCVSHKSVFNGVTCHNEK